MKTLEKRKKEKKTLEDEKKEESRRDDDEEDVCRKQIIELTVLFVVLDVYLLCVFFFRLARSWQL